ncbi:MAG TPA: ankyrin repeat domain-containing protein [Gemmatimonadales bacterium]|nr:ankyrin repeat domain-containing protein [Gemmatimonadales bacterium]
MQRLLDAGTSPDQSIGAESPLVAAIRTGSDTMVAELLAFGADPLVAGADSSNAWDAVFERGDAVILDRLIRHTTIDAGGGPAVSGWLDAVRGDKADAPQWHEVLSGELLSLGLMYAALHDRPDLIRPMRRAREIPNRTGYHAIAVAARWNREPALQALLAIGTHPDLATASRTTALMEAARGGRLAIARRLLSAGADPNHVDLKGETALDWAVRFGQEAYADLLLSSGARTH